MSVPKECAPPWYFCFRNEIFKWFVLQEVPGAAGLRSGRDIRNDREFSAWSRAGMLLEREKGMEE